MALAEARSCTITNDDVAFQLTVIEQVVNPDGGPAIPGDFTMLIGTTSPSLSSFPGEGVPGATIFLDPGPYSIGGTGPSGYAALFSPDYP